MQEALGEIVHVVVIFDAPTIARMAAYLRAQHPAAVARLLGGGGPGAETAESDDGPAIDEAAVTVIQDLAARLPRHSLGRPAARPANPPALFVLAPPRSGTTLLRVILGGHPGLFAPPELELLSFDTMGERARAFQGRDGFWLEGALRAVMEARGCAAEEARELVARAEADDESTQRFYGRLQEWIGDRLLVDKTPSYALWPGILERAEAEFESPRYLHLVRHPYGMIRSFEEAKLDQIFFHAEHPYTRRRLAELLWTVSHRNILAFLAGVPAERRMTVHFERLVRTPEREIGRICDFLGLEMHEAMVDPYRDGRRRMTDGLHQASRMLGDVKFHQHAGIDPAVADRWRQDYRRDFLGEPTRRVAARLGQGDVRIERLLPPSVVALRPGPPEDERPPLFMVHPVSGDVYFYRDLIRGLDDDRPVYGFQAPGLEGSEEPVGRLADLAARYVDSLETLHPEGPVLLAGSSMGGTIAYEMARQLRARGRCSALVALIDTPGPGQLPDRFRPGDVEATILGYLSGGSDGPDAATLGALPEEERIAFLLGELERAGRLRDGVGERELRRLIEVVTSNQRAMIEYPHPSYDGRVTFFRAEDGGPRYREVRETPWRELVRGGLELHVCPGNHLSMNRPPHAAHLARALQAALDAALDPSLDADRREPLPCRQVAAGD